MNLQFVTSTGRGAIVACSALLACGAPEDENRLSAAAELGGDPGGEVAAAATCDGSVPCLLSAGLVFSNSLWPSPDGQRVVFLRRADNVISLYSVPVRGGTPVRLSELPSPSFRAIAPDGSRVLYVAAPAPGQPLALFSVPIAGPASAGVLIARDVSSAFASAQVSPDSRKVVYLVSNRRQLRVVPTGGPADAGARLTGEFANPQGGIAGDLNDPGFMIGGNGASVVYRAAQERPQAELFRVPLTLTPDPDPPTIKLNGLLVEGGNVSSFRLAAATPDVIYRANQDDQTKFELFRVKMNGTERVKLNVPLPPDWNATEVQDAPPAALRGYHLAPGDARVVYEVANVVVSPTEQRLYSVPTAGPASANVRLDAPPTGIQAASYRVSEDGRQVVYDTRDPDGVTFALLTVPTGGPAGASVELLTQRGEPQFVLTPNSQQVVFVRSGADPGLFRGPIAGGSAVRIDGPEVPGRLPAVTPDSARVVYVASTGETDVFSAPLGAGGARVNLTAALPTVAVAPVAPILTADGVHAVYTVLPAVGSDEQLYSSQIVPP